MLINHKYGFIFIKPFKCGSTSVEYALLKDFGYASVAYYLSQTLLSELGGMPHKRIIKNSHLSFEEVKLLEDYSNKYSIVSITRNPYERFLSYVNWLEGIDSYKKNGYFKRLAGDELVDALARHYENFIIDVTSDQQLWNTSCIWLRFTSLQADYEMFCDRYGVTPSKLLIFKKALGTTSELPHAYIERINRDLSEEFKFHGYTKI